jgi:undecaprenyl-diphosphatase
MNSKLFKTINQFSGRNRIIDVFMITISQRLRYLFVLFLLILWFRNNFHKRITLYAGISGFITLLITSIIKLFYFKPRPFLKHSVNLLAPVPSKKDSSFPSKHTTIAFAIAISILFYKRTIGWILSVFAFFTGLSRIWMGQHYPSDIFFSALLGSFVAIGVNINTRMWNPIITRVMHAYNNVISLRKF